MHKCQPLLAFIPASPSLPPLAALHSFTGSSPPKKNKTKIKLLCICFPALYPIHYFSHTSLFLASRLYSPHCFTHSFPSLPPPPLHRYCTVLQQACLTSPLFLFHCLFFLPISLPLSTWGSSSDIITPTVTMVSERRKKNQERCNNCLDQTDSLCASASLSLTHTHTQRQGWREYKEILFYYRIKVQLAGLCETVVCVRGQVSVNDGSV